VLDVASLGLYTGRRRKITGHVQTGVESTGEAGEKGACDQRMEGVPMEEVWKDHSLRTYKNCIDEQHWLKS